MSFNLDTNASTYFNLEPAKRYFIETLKLTKVFNECAKCWIQTEKVPVDEGSCISTLICDEYKGVKVQKFFAKGDTSMLLPGKGLCKGFIIQNGAMCVTYDNGRKKMLLPEERHFFYIRDDEEIKLSFSTDTWFYVISMHF